MVVEVILGVVKVVPLPKLVTPVLVAYQFNVPALAVAPSVTFPVPQILLGVLLVMLAVGFTVATTGVLVDEHPPT